MPLTENRSTKNKAVNTVHELMNQKSGNTNPMVSVLKLSKWLQVGPNSFLLGGSALIFPLQTLTLNKKEKTIKWRKKEE